MAGRKRFELEGTSSPEGNIFAGKGFADRKRMNLGVLNRSTSSASVINPQTGNRVFFTRFNYPVDGLGLEYVLSALVPSDRKSVDRGGTVDDWEEPDQARKLLALGQTSDVKALRYQAHQKIPGFNEFDENHRVSWIKTINNKEFDKVFSFLGYTDFIDPELFTNFLRGHFKQYFAKEKGRGRTLIAGRLPQGVEGPQIVEMLAKGLQDRSADDSRRQRLDTEAVARFFRLLRYETTFKDGKEVTQESVNGRGIYTSTMYLPERIKLQIHDLFWQILSVVPKDVEQNVLIAFYNMWFQGGMHTFIDPKTKRIWGPEGFIKGEKEFAAKSGIALDIRENGITVAADGVVVALKLGKPDSKGYRETDNTQFLFTNGYEGLTPLLAVEEVPGKNGQPPTSRFLTQQEALRIIPKKLRQSNLDVMLGRVMLAYLQPEVTANFAEKMGYPQPHTRYQHQYIDEQNMLRTQMPVWVTFYENDLLSTPAVNEWKQAVKAA